MDDSAEADRVRLQLEQVEARLAELRAVANAVGQTLVVLGELLMQDPFQIRFTGEARPAASPGGGFPLVERQHLDAERIRGVIEQLRETVAEREQLQQRLERLGRRPA